MQIFYRVQQVKAQIQKLCKEVNKVTKELERIIVKLADRTNNTNGPVHLMIHEELNLKEKNTIVLRFPTWDIRFEGHCIWMFTKEGAV